MPDGRLAILRLRLSDEPGLDDPIFELPLRSAVPFAPDRPIAATAQTARPMDGAAPSARPIRLRHASGRAVVLKFSAPPEQLDILRARDALRITPPVDDLKADSSSDDTSCGSAASSRRH